MEQSFIAWLRGRCASLPQVEVGIGDDAAILQLPTAGESLVVCTDQIVDGVDFLSSQHAAADIGRKSVLINLSDMAAMAATPITLLVNLSLPTSDATQLAAGVYEGILAVAQQYNLSISGGDITVYDGPLGIAVTVLGTVPQQRRWLRSGAKEGDAIVVTGAFGGSILGRHLTPTPRLQAALQIAEAFDVHAAIDVSDGLSLDLDRLCAASGVGAEFELSAIPLHEDAHRLAEQDGQTAVEHAWGDGEDFELILAIPPGEVDRLLAMNLDVPLTRLGTFTGRTGLWARKPLAADSLDETKTAAKAKPGKPKASSQLERLSPRGFIHGRRS